MVPNRPSVMSSERTPQTPSSGTLGWHQALLQSSALVAWQLGRLRAVSLKMVTFHLLVTNPAMMLETLPLVQ